MIHPTAVVSSDADIGKDVEIGPYSIIHSSARLGEKTKVGSHCIIGHPATGEYQSKALVIGKGSNIRAHTIIYEGSNLGNYLETGHHVLIRAGTIAGENLRAGVYVDIEGECHIGDYCRLHSSVTIGQGSLVGSFVWMYPHSILPNDPLPPSYRELPCEVGDGAVICTGAMLQPGTKLGIGAYVTAKSFAKGDVPAGAVVSGDNGRIITNITRLFDRKTRAYHPWMELCINAYPEVVHSRLKELQMRVLESIDVQK